MIDLVAKISIILIYSKKKRVDFWFAQIFIVTLSPNK